MDPVIYLYDNQSNFQRLNIHKQFLRVFRESSGGLYNCNLQFETGKIKQAESLYEAVKCLVHHFLITNKQNKNL